MKNLLLLAVGALEMSACAPTLSPGVYTLAPQAGVPAGIIPVGTVSATKSSSITTTTSARLTGLTANTFYVAHYHTMGAASTDPCKSGGPIIMSSMIVGQTDATGTLLLSGSVASADLTSATSFKVHAATDSLGTPADAGVACTAVVP
jgi:Cu-Zn family superoxide dismutase